MTDVTVYGGKYRYIFDKDGARALRHGEPWRDCCGDGFILALAQDLEEAREQRDRLREALEDLIDVALELDELVHYDRGAGKYVEDKCITKARASLQQLENNQ